MFTANRKRIADFLIYDIGFELPMIVNSISFFDENGLYILIGMRQIHIFVDLFKKEGVLKKTIDRYEELINLPEDSNPIIFFYKFK